VQDRFSLDTLLAPVDGGGGADPRSDPAFFDVKDARVEARMAERDALASDDPEADPLAAGRRAWVRAADAAGTLLATRAKDLQLASWLTEAWLRIDSFAGLAAGFALMAGLIELYWDDGLHPQEDEEGLEARVAPLFGLFGRGEAGTLLQPIKLQPLTDRPGDPVALWTIENTRAQSTRHDDPDVRDELVARREEKIAAMDDAIARASPTFVDALVTSIEIALFELDRLMTAIDQRTPFGRFGSQVQQPLEEALRVLRAVHESEPAAAPPVDAAPAAIATQDTGAATPAPVVAAPVARGAMTRDGALATLLEVAAFFERNEPQSLMGFGLRELVRRAEMPVDELLRELLPEDDQRRMFLLRAGIRAPADNGSYY
jgi:type VI secretion system protein ImpA